MNEINHYKHTAEYHGYAVRTGISLQYNKDLYKGDV